MAELALVEPGDPAGAVVERVIEASRRTWLASVASDSALPDEAVDVAEAIARQVNRRSLAPLVPGSRLAEMTGLEDQSVWMALRLLEDRGHLVRIKAPPRPNAYGPTLPPNIRHPREPWRRA